MSMNRATNSETATVDKNQELCINVCHQDFVHSPYEFRFSPPVSPENSNQDISDVATDADTAEEYTVIAAEPHAHVSCMQQQQHQYYTPEYHTPQFSPYTQHPHLLSDQCDRLYDYAYSQLPLAQDYTDYSDYSPQYSTDANSPHVPSEVSYHHGTEYEVMHEGFAPHPSQHVSMHEMEYAHAHVRAPLHKPEQPQSHMPLPLPMPVHDAACVGAGANDGSESYDLSIALANMPTRILKRKRKVHRGGTSSFFLDELPQQTTASNTGSLSAIMATSVAVPNSYGRVRH